MYEHDPQIAFLEVLVKVNGIAEKIVDGSDGFHSCKAPACGNDSHQRFSGIRALEIGLLQILNQAVSQKDRVTERFHRQRVFFKARKVVIVGDVPDAYDKVVILKLVVMMITSMGDLDQPGLEINAFHIALKKLNPFKQLPDGIDDVGHIQIARSHLMKHRCEEEKVIVIDERNFEVPLARDGPFHLKSGVKTAKATAKNDNALLHKSATSQ